MKTASIVCSFLLLMSAGMGRAESGPVECSDLSGAVRHPLEPGGKAGSVLLFYWHDCPICNSYAPEINRLSADYTNFSFYIVQVDPDLTPEAARTHARQYDLHAPVLLDPRHRLVRLANATVAPEAVVYVKGGRAIWRGRIDNLYASLNQRRAEATVHDLRDALNAIAAGRPVSAGQPAMGCLISTSAAAVAAPTFDKDIAPILYKNCAVCHRTGEVAPFSLLTFGDAGKRAKQIARVTSERIMPPWKAEAGFGEFANDRHLPPEQIALIQDWAQSGAAEGSKADLPEAPKFADGWTLGEPDAVLEPDEDYHLDAEGPDIYRCFVIPTKFTEGHYVRAMEIRPGNRKVVHHVIVHYDTTGAARALDARDPGPGYTSFGGVGFRSSGMIGGWAPGNFPSLLPEGIGRMVPQDADLVVQVHYHRSGKPETDRTKVGLYFAKGPVDKRIRAKMVVHPLLRIPPGDSDYVVHASLPVTEDVTAYRVTPHMHLLGRDMKVTATLPDGTLLPLVHVSNWDFNWQTSYEFAQPLHLPAGSRLDMEAHYDNSAANPLNPNNPPKIVRWGEQTTDEMCLAFVSYTLDKEHLARGREPK
ncbi:MAG TPA: redoxin domain-containing protein [Verrucomicrobiae bacterium]|jgi:mono/diheme cytochrome c family protein/thiol-disulfide isomerase/thioredoxin